MANKSIMSFLDDKENFSLIKHEDTFYIFKDMKTLKEVKITVLDDNHLSFDFKDHFDE